jgi:hypothetical protein
MRSVSNQFSVAHRAGEEDYKRLKCFTSNDPSRTDKSFSVLISLPPIIASFDQPRGSILSNPFCWLWPDHCSRDVPPGPRMRNHIQFSSFCNHRTHVRIIDTARGMRKYPRKAKTKEKIIQMKLWECNKTVKARGGRIKRRGSLWENVSDRRSFRQLDPQLINHNLDQLISPIAEPRSQTRFIFHVSEWLTVLRLFSCFSELLDSLNTKHSTWRGESPEAGSRRKLKDRSDLERLNPR